MKKTGLLALGLALAIGVVAEAGSIPTDRVPLQTYAVKKLNCYLQPNGVQKGWIDPGDYVVVTQIRSDGWAYGSYPVGNGRVSRWFRADDLVNNIGFANQERYSPKANTYTYTNPNHNKQFGSFNDNEPILVVSDSGQSRQFIYKLNSGGYKMAWAPYWDCWDARQAGKQQVNNNTINTNPIVKPVQREEKKQEQSSSYGVWKATARYRANTYDNPNLSGARAGWVTAGSDIEVLGENSKSYYIRYWTDNGTPRKRYVERTAVKGLDEDKDNKKQVNNNTINTNPIVKPVQREEKKQEQSSSYGVWKATARYRANTYDNPNLSGARAGWVTAGSDIEVLGENSKSYYIRYWTDNGSPRERYVERTAVKGLNEDNKKQVNNNTINTNPIVKPVQREDKKQEQSSSYGVWKATARYRANTYDNPNLSGARAGWVTAGSDLEVLGENAKSYYIRYWTDNGDPRERYVMKSAIQKIADGAMYGVNKAVEAAKKENYIWPVDNYNITALYYYSWGGQHSSKVTVDGCRDQFDNYKSIDIGARLQDVKAVADGEVIFSNFVKGYGNLIVIKHANEVYSMYGHLAKRYFQKGCTVNQGSIIGQSGNTGSSSTGYHLHFAISKFSDPNMNTWKYFREKYKFNYAKDVKIANQKHPNDSQSKEAIQWLSSH